MWLSAYIKSSGKTKPEREKNRTWMNGHFNSICSLIRRKLPFLQRKKNEIAISYDTIRSSWSSTRNLTPLLQCLWMQGLYSLQLSYEESPSEIQRKRENIPALLMHEVCARRQMLLAGSLFSLKKTSAPGHTSQPLEKAQEYGEQCKLGRMLSCSSEADEVVSCHSCGGSMTALTLFLQPVYSVATQSQRAVQKVYTVIVGQGIERNGTPSHLTDMWHNRDKLKWSTPELSIGFLAWAVT